MKLHPPTISVIITTYDHRGKDLEEMLEVLMKSDYPAISEVIVVDNNSTDNTVEMVKKKFPLVKIIESKINLGGGGGRNLGMKKADPDSDYLLFLDNDFILEKNTISELVKAIDSLPRYGACTGKILFYNRQDTVQIGPNSVGLLTGLNYIGSGPDDGRFDKKVDSWTGGCLLIKQKVARRVGFYDEIYPIPYEDADYSIRIIKTGWRILFVPQARIYHKTPYFDKESGTRRWLQGAYYTARNKIIFMRKHSPCFLCFILFFPVYPLFYTYLSLRYHEAKRLLDFYRGIVDGFKWALFEYEHC